MHTRSNGTKHRVEVNDSDLEQRHTTLDCALMLYNERENLHKRELYATARVLGESGLLAYSHIARIAGTSVSTLKRNGVRVPGQRKGGVFNPAQLATIVRALHELKENGTYAVQCIRDAYENGNSAGVLGRFLGLSHTYVLTLVRMADNDRNLVSVDTRARRTRNREDRVGSGVAEFTVDADRIDTTGLTAEERAVMDRFAGHNLNSLAQRFTVEDDSVDESGTAADETGQSDSVDNHTPCGSTDTNEPTNGNVRFGYNTG